MEVHVCRSIFSNRLFQTPNMKKTTNLFRFCIRLRMELYSAEFFHQRNNAKQQRLREIHIDPGIKYDLSI